MRTTIPAVLLATSLSCLAAPDSIELGSPPLRFSVDARSGLPVFLGVSERNWIPAIPAELNCVETCQLESVEVNEGQVRTVWQTESQRRLRVEYSRRDGGLDLLLSSDVEMQVALRIPYDPLLTSITFLSSTRNVEAQPLLPGILSAPDIGQILVQPVGGEVVARMLGSRGQRRITWVLEFSLKPAAPLGARFSLPPRVRIDGVAQDMSDVAARYWWNIFTTRAESDPRLELDPTPVHRLQQMIANNTLSDPVSFALFNVADMALLVQETPAVSLMRIVQDSLTWWLNNQVTDRGVAIGYGGYSVFLDANPSLLISAWDVVEKTRDEKWLREHIRKLEVLGNYLAARDVDGDGLVEAEVSGTPGTLIEPGRSSNWIDAINFGHKDAFSNALIYRAWLCLADLERRLGNWTLAAFYRQLAAKLKQNYVSTFYNPQTRMLAGWVDAAGRRAPYRFPGVNGLAVSVGLIDHTAAQDYMRRIVSDLAEAGFRRYDLGVPLTLDPIQPFDYLSPGGLGYPDISLPGANWQKYENGGITPTQTAYYLQGLIRAGLPDEAKRILQAMLGTQTATGFQNGIVNEYPRGVDWRTWDGEACGYEGYLNDNYYYLSTAAILDPGTYRRVFRTTLE